MDPCPFCLGELWMCEDHPALPWQHGDCGGAGIACVSNPRDAVRWQKLIAETLTDALPN